MPKTLLVLGIFIWRTNMDIRKESLKKHYDWGGKIEVISRAPINSREDLSLAYTPNDVKIRPYPRHEGMVFFYT